jgi:Transglutaminase-like superfamily
MGLTPTKRFTIGDGDLGTSQTIDKIRKLVHEGMTDQLVNRTAIAIVQQAGVQQFNFTGEIQAIYNWVAAHVRFVRDVFGVETLRTAREILSTRAGDCDDINAVLLPSLLMTVGAHVRLVTIASDPRDPNTFTHIYCEVELPNGQWLPIDSARRNAAFGRGPQHYYRMRRWSLTDSYFEDLPAGNTGKSSGPAQRMGLSGYFANLGDDGDGFDWGGLASIITAGTQGAANIITSMTPRIVPTGFAQNPVSGQLVPLTPQGTLVASSAPGGVFTSASGSIPNWLLYAGLGLAALLVLRR